MIELTKNNNIENFISEINKEDKINSILDEVVEKIKFFLKTEFAIDDVIFNVRTCDVLYKDLTDWDYGNPFIKIFWTGTLMTTNTSDLKYTDSSIQVNFHLTNPKNEIIMKDILSFLTYFISEEEFKTRTSPLFKNFLTEQVSELLKNIITQTP